MRSASSFDWETLLAGQAVPVPKKRWLFCAHWAALRVARAFTRSGLAASLLVLEKVHGHPGARLFMQRLPEEARLFLAREVAWQSRGVVRTLYGQRMCLFESLTSTAALRALGLPAHTVVGYATGFGSPKTPVHAWIALGDVPVSDLQYVGQRYAEITQYPHDRKDYPCTA